MQIFYLSEALTNAILLLLSALRKAPVKACLMEFSLIKSSYTIYLFFTESAIHNLFSLPEQLMTYALLACPLVFIRWMLTASE